MSVWGKVLGACLGFLLGGPLGLLLGLFFGHKLDKVRQRLIFSTSGGAQAAQQLYFHATFSVMGHLAKAKGNVTEREIRLASDLMDKMGLYGEVRREAQNAFREGKEADFPLEQTLENVRRNCGLRIDLLQFFLEVQIQAAFADGSIHPAEEVILQKIGARLGFSPAQLAQRIAMQEAAFEFHRNQQFNHSSSANSGRRLQGAYQLLGVAEDCDDATLKRAYRKLMNEHHPDKLAAKGLPASMMEMAKKKTQEIQEAYELIKKARE
ncbi:MAG: co-chaperone DjlA [Vibrionaceae bacterium]